jgi:L-fuconolactonase
MRFGLGVIRMIIDAHQHFWKTSRGDYPWLTPDLQVLNRDYLPEDLAPILKEHHITKTILVQAAPTVDETEFLLKLAENTDYVAGVVGWLDLAAGDFSEKFSRMRSNPKFVGLRPMLQDLNDDAWILRPEVLLNIELLVKFDFPLELLVHPRHLPFIVELLRRYPTLRAVIDHAAKPQIEDQIMQPWQDWMEQLSRYDNVMCKLSSLITQADLNRWTVEDIAPYVRHVVYVFGANAVMFGSDWPYCLLGGSYKQVLEALRTALPQDLTVDELSSVFGRNAEIFYKLDRY